MIDINLLRNQEKKCWDLLMKKDPSLNLQEILDLDSSLRKEKSELEALLAERNRLSSIGKDMSAEQHARAKELSSLCSLKKEGVTTLEISLHSALSRVPNVPDEVVPEGNKEQNVVVRSWSSKPEILFQAKNHLELNQELKWFDLVQGANIAESGFVFYNEFGAKLTYALTRLMIRHNKKWGFTPVMPPYVVSLESLFRTGLLPKFEGDFYQCKDDSLALTPTAEVCITNFHAGKTYESKDLPIRNCAWTPCFRREAGGYGANERGLIRIHQFEKVELYSVSEPEKSSMELERMVACAEEFLQSLGLHYRVSLLAAQDCSFASSKTYDIEVWLAGQNKYYEVSSCSNCTDYQARRAKIKYRQNADVKPCFVHTLNASSLALPRLIVALMETYQTATGEVILPEVIVKEMECLW